ncbi:chemotaxis protein CheD [bacterium]|nr:chemotaxis protein CheD [bacterium]MBU1637805.1 chemotaxis protein CheD [bacterium]
MKLAKGEGNLIVTHALGSCIGIALIDPVAKVGGILHFMLPDSKVNPERAESSKWMFADRAVPAYFEQAYAMGASKQRLSVYIAGGAQFVDKKDVFAIGKRNHTALRKIFWKLGILIKGENIGGTISRTLYLDVDSGACWFSSGGKEFKL